MEVPNDTIVSPEIAESSHTNTASEAIAEHAATTPSQDIVNSSASDEATTIPTLPNSDDIERMEKSIDTENVRESISDSLQRFKGKFNLSKLLNISSQELDRQFEKIKQTTDNAIQQAKEQMPWMKQDKEGNEATEAFSPVDKLRGWTKKFGFGKKKEDNE